MRSDPGVEPWVEEDITSPQAAQATASPQPDTRPGSDRQDLPLNEDGHPLPTREQIRAADHTRSYHLPPGAIMSLSVPSIGLRNVPVMDSVTTSALNQDVVHLPDTSLPWSDTPERNVYLAGHCLGWPGTGSHLVFYRLNELDGEERITLRGPEGERYHYTVVDAFSLWPEER